MNFDRISFRTNEKERQFLTTFGQTHKCKSVTDLMHKLMHEIMEKRAFDKDKVANVFGDLQIQVPARSEKHASSKSEVAPKASRPTRQEFETLFDSIDGSKPQAESQPVYDPLEKFLEDLSYLERLKNAMNRVMPNKPGNPSV